MLMMNYGAFVCSGGLVFVILGCWDYLADSGSCYPTFDTCPHPLVIAQGCGMEMERVVM
jgi:hypothetical protein